MLYGGAGGKWLITSNVILVIQGVPALDLLVLVLQTLVPVLQPLSFGSDTELAPTCRGKGKCSVKGRW